MSEYRKRSAERHENRGIRTLAGLLLLGSACADTNGSMLPQGELAGESPALTAATVELVDAPSSPAIVMRWRMPQDGARAVSSLDFEVENTTGQPVDVSIEVISQAGKVRGTGRGSKRRLLAREVASESVNVGELGVQVVGKSTNTTVIASYTGIDGTPLQVPLMPVWVEHADGFGAAYVRSDAVEADKNAQRHIARLGRAKVRDARTFDAAKQQLNRVAADAAEFEGGELVATLPEFPDLATLRANSKASVLETSGPSDAERGRAASADVLTDKGGFYTICMRVGTFFVDADLGEDHLNSQTTSAVGQEPARYMAAIIMNSANQVLFANYLNAVGCTTSINLANGSYAAYITSSLYRSGNNVGIDVTNDDTKTFSWGSWGFNISGSGGTLTLDSVGFSVLSDAAAAASNTIYRATHHYAAGTHTNLYVGQTCPWVPGSGCASGESIWLGSNANGLPYAVFKTTTTHELGHRSMSSLFGTPINDYAIDATQASCRCDHVTSSNNLHCLQGRAMVTAAQVEGWGQYFAAKNFNEASHSNCTFAYYKEFREDNGTVVAPPMAKSCFNQVRWQNNRCNASGRGTEFDWMNFYWRLDAKDSYLPNDFKQVYYRACSNASCSGKNVPWSSLVSAANAEFGSTGAKALAWSAQGANYGVNH